MFRTHIFLISVMLSGSVLATAADQDNHFVIGLSAGSVWMTGNQKQAINLESDVAKTYTANSIDSAVVAGELFAGWQKAFVTLHQPVVGQLGMSLVDTGDAKLSGDIWEDSNPAFDNSTYTYNVTHAHLAVKGRLIGNYNALLQPYLSASVGVGYNRAHDFTIHPSISEEVAPPDFQANSTTTFTYTLGIGFQTAITPHLQAALGYEFADWGKVQLARASGQTMNQGLTLNHLYGNQLQLSLFYTV